MTTPSNLTSDERIFAALAHGSVIFSFFGPIGPIIVWLLQRRKSSYASFQALQAMGFQVLSFWLWILVSILSPVVLLVFFLLGVLIFGTSDNFEFFPIAFQGLFFITIFGLWGVYFLFGLIGAGFCVAGKDFRYPLLGTLLAKYLNNSGEIDQTFDEEREDSWVSAVCHATAVIFMWGIAAPFVVWFTQKKRSIRLSFHAAQAIVYQLFALVVYFVGMALYTLLFFGMIATVFVGGAMTPDVKTVMPPWIIMMASVVLVLIGIFWLVMIIATPIYFILSGIGSIRTLRGHDFRYPIIGHIIARKMGYSAELVKSNSEA